MLRQYILNIYYFEQLVSRKSRVYIDEKFHSYMFTYRFGHDDKIKFLNGFLNSDISSPTNPCWILLHNKTMWRHVWKETLRIQCKFRKSKSRLKIWKMQAWPYCAIILWNSSKILSKSVWTVVLQWYSPLKKIQSFTAHYRVFLLSHI